MTNKGEEENAGKKVWSTLFDLVTLVMSFLSVKDTIRASSVCKLWYKASASIQMKRQHLWLMRIPFHSALERPCELYDPSQGKTYTVAYPEAQGMKVYYSRDGWLLMKKCRAPEIFFFNPLARKLIYLPNCERYNESAIFTCAPTSNNCLVFGMTDIENSVHIVGVNTFRMGETAWKTSSFPSPENGFAYNSQIVFSGGVFYCHGGFGSLTGFDPSKQTWTTYSLKCHENLPNSITTGRGNYLVEIKADVFFLKSVGGKLRVFRLKRGEVWDWEEKDIVGEGITVFGAFRATEFISDLPSKLRNSVLLSDPHFPVIQTYCFNQGKYQLSSSSTPSNDQDDLLKTFQSIWIEPPKQLLEFT